MLKFCVPFPVIIFFEGGSCMSKISMVLKVNSKGGSLDKQTPCIRIQGLWLEDLGFKADDMFKLEGEPGKIIFSIVEPGEALPENTKRGCIAGGGV
jgi:hypothetical protein